MVEFVKRCKVEKTDVGTRRAWRSRCGKYQLVKQEYDCKALKPIWRAFAWKDAHDWWHWLEPAQHMYRTRAAAEKAIQAHAKAAGG